MSATSTVQRLARGIAEAKKAANFCVTGVLPIRDPGLEVMQTGGVNLPLTRRATKELIAQCRVAPYGRGRKRSSPRRCARPLSSIHSSSV